MEYSNKISLIKNGRGIYCLDPSIGCNSGMTHTEGGCYGDCYAAKAAKRYGHDFSKTILRRFVNTKHRRTILNQIYNISMPFIRMGCSGDPSENWNHTFTILNAIKGCNKEIIIITRHWTILTEYQLAQLSGMNICINTSVSALDEEKLMNHCLEQYERVKPYCKSILRIVSCDFNLNNEVGLRLSIIQHGLFKNESILDTVFRPSKHNKLITDGIINVRDEIFNGSKQLASKLNRKTYMGKCSTCKEMCGLNIGNDHINKPGLVKQLSLL